MHRVFSPRSLARKSARHPWITFVAWVVVIAAGVAGASMLKFDDTQSIQGSESLQASELLEDMNGEAPPTEVVVVEGPGGVDSPEFRARVEQLITDFRAMPETVAQAVSYYETGDDSLVNADRTTLIIPLVLAGNEKDAVDTVKPLIETLREGSTDGFTLTTMGNGSLFHDFGETAQEDLEKGEMIGLPVALIILVVVFGAAVAAGLPVVLGIVGIILAAGITGVVSRYLGVTSYALNMITMIGLAVGIDYTLFIIERFREERNAGREKLDAIEIAGNTASRAVLFSGLTVMIAMAGLLIVPDRSLAGLVVGAVSVVLAAMAIALTLLPALLSVLGDKVNIGTLPFRRRKAHNPNHEGGFFGVTTRFVQKHAAVSALLSAGVLVAAAAPLVNIKLGTDGASSLPQNIQSAHAFSVLDSEFSAGRVNPLRIMFEGDVNDVEVSQGVAALRRHLDEEPLVANMSTLSVNQEGNLGIIEVQLNGDASSEAAQDFVKELRSETIPASFPRADVDIAVGGASAETVDFIDTYTTYLPYVIGFVLSLSFILLMMVFRSVVIPLKAIVMNLLSVGAAYGLLVLVFQEGIGNELFGFNQSDSINAFLPIFLFAVLFGLSMDYHVFLLSRIHERFMETGDNTAAVGYGLRSTAHIITGAAAIMMVVFGGFAAGELTALQQVGFGLAAAVFLDATIVRSVLVPSTMQLLGARNWYLPKWMSWLPSISVEGAAEPVAPRLIGPEYTPAGGK